LGELLDQRFIAHGIGQITYVQAVVHIKIFLEKRKEWLHQRIPEKE
jgi:hypothetical protein